MFLPLTNPVYTAARFAIRQNLPTRQHVKTCMPSVSSPRFHRDLQRGLGVVVVLLALTLAPGAGAADLHSFAFVQDDGTLKISGTVVHLYGIHIPETERSCRTFQRPVKCAPRAVLALDFKVSGFVRCEVVERNPDLSVTATCEVDGEDLGAYLLSQGWALALPEAPFEYAALEKIARHHNLGVWGIAIELLPRR